MNQLQHLDVSGCPELQELDCWMNQLQSLDVSQCPELRELGCEGNQMDNSAMIALVESLPIDPDDSDLDQCIRMDGNPEAERRARLKRWSVN